MRAETQAAIETVVVAQRLANSGAGADRITRKSGRDIVTAADVACEDAIREGLRKVFPEYPVVGEERGGEPAADRPYWLVDPICGTRSYASGLPVYCTNVALVEDGVVTVGVIGVGGAREVIYAERGSGARMQDRGADQRISATDQSETIWVDGRTDEAFDLVRRMQQLDRWYVWMFSSSVFYAYLAAGRISGVLHFRMRSDEPPVHTAAGCLVASEAGAAVLDLETREPWNLDSRSFLAAATPALQRDLLDLIDQR